MDDDGATDGRPLHVSIVIDNCNYARYLGAAIDSALAQDHPHVEVIVVDDGSTDDSLEVIAGYASRGVVLVGKENGGQASAFNAGIARATGDYVILLDADDRLEPDCARTVVAAAGSGPAKVHWRLQAIDAGGAPLPFTDPPAGRRLPSGDLVASVLRRGRSTTPVTSGNAFSRKVLEAITPVPEERYRISADGYLCGLAPLHGTVVAIDRTLGCYRIHGENRWVGGRLDEGRLHQLIAHDEARVADVSTEARRLGMTVRPDALRRDAGHLRYALALAMLAGRRLDRLRAGRDLVWATLTDPTLTTVSKTRHVGFAFAVGVGPVVLARRMLDSVLLHRPSQPTDARSGARWAGDHRRARVARAARETGPWSRTVRPRGRRGQDRQAVE